MAFDNALLATDTEVSLFLLGRINPGDFGWTPTQYETARAMIHEAAEAQVLHYVNRSSLTVATLAAYPHMAAAYKMATVMLVSRYFGWLKEQKSGEIVSLQEMTIEIRMPQIFDKSIKDVLRPYRKLSVGAVGPDDSITVI